MTVGYGPIKLDSIRIIFLVIDYKRVSTWSQLPFNNKKGLESVYAELKTR